MVPAGQNEMEEGTGSSGPPRGPSLGQAQLSGNEGPAQPGQEAKWACEGAPYRSGRKAPGTTQTHLSALVYSRTISFISSFICSLSPLHPTDMFTSISLASTN